MKISASHDERTCTHTHTRSTYIHRYIHIYIHTYIHIHTYARTYIHTYIHTYVLTYIHTYIHTYIRTYVHTYIRTYRHTYIHTYICTVYVFTCAHACRHVHTRYVTHKNVPSIEFYMISQLALLCCNVQCRHFHLYVPLYCVFDIFSFGRKVTLFLLIVKADLCCVSVFSHQCCFRTHAGESLCCGNRVVL